MITFKSFIAEHTQAGPELIAFMAEYHAGTASHPFDRRTRIHNNSVGMEVSIFDGKIHLSSIISFAEKNAGEASKTMKFLTDLADKHQVALDLEVQPLKNAGAREGKNLTKSQLMSWYKRVGFVKGRGEDMIRKPKITEAKDKYTSAMPDSAGKFAVDKEAMLRNKQQAKAAAESTHGLVLGHLYQKKSSMVPTWARISEITEKRITFTEYIKFSADTLRKSRFDNDKLSCASFVKEYSNKATGQKFKLES